MPQIDGSLANLYSSRFSNAFGWFRSVSDGTYLIRLDWNQTGWRGEDYEDDVSRETKAQLLSYFTGGLQTFNLPLSPEGKSKRGRYWLDIMAKIPYGTVVSYAEFATFAGNSGAARAAGSACAGNPIPIIYPCHRIVKSDGKLGNYGGGSDKAPATPDNLARKAKLITLERAFKTSTA